MIYQLRINCYFTDEDALDNVMDKLEDAKDKMTVINPGQPDQECSVIEQIHCYHDQYPHEPCIEVDHWNNCPVSP